jgi:hypothetical protein
MFAQNDAMNAGKRLLVAGCWFLTSVFRLNLRLAVNATTSTSNQLERLQLVNPAQTP